MLLAEPFMTPGGVVRQPQPVAVSISGLCVAYGASSVLAGADLQVVTGTRTVLLGANGSGKTTLLRCVSGDRRPDSGEVEVRGRLLEYTGDGLREHQRLVQFVGSHPVHRFEELNVYTEVAAGPTELGLSAAEVRDRVDEALDLLSIADLAERPLGRLSHGERKRVSLAGAVASRPAVLLLDEPTEGLDPRGRSGLMAALRLLQDESVTVVVATHDADFALAWAESVAVIEDGLIRHGNPGELLTDSKLVSGSGLRRPLVVSVLSGLGERTDGVIDVLGLVGRLGDLLDVHDAAIGD